jgi:ketosteroid isomerase-like protein
MSQESAQELLDEINRHDVEALVARVHPDIEWDAALIGTPIYRGRTGIRKLLRDVEKSWEAWQLELEDLVEHGDAVVIGFRMRARGRSSGAAVEAKQFLAAELEDGLARRVRIFMTKRQALEAVGLGNRTSSGAG